MLCLDLILMVRYPFAMKESRLKKYLLAAFCFAVPPAAFLTFRPKKLTLMRMGAGWTVAYVCIYFIVFCISVLYTWTKLRGPSFSKEVRNLVLKRHIITSLTYLLFNMYLFFTMYALVFYNLEDLYVQSDDARWWVLTFKLMFAAQGFVIPFLRLSEPYFYQAVCKKLKSLTISAGLIKKI